MTTYVYPFEVIATNPELNEVSATCAVVSKNTGMCIGLSDNATSAQVFCDALNRVCTDFVNSRGTNKVAAL